MPRPKPLLALGALVTALLGIGVSCAQIGACAQECNARYPHERDVWNESMDRWEPSEVWGGCHDTCMRANAPSVHAEQEARYQSRKSYTSRSMDEAGDAIAAGDEEEAHLIYAELCELYSYVPACSKLYDHAKQLLAEGDLEQGDAQLERLCDKWSFEPACDERHSALVEPESEPELES